MSKLLLTGEFGRRVMERAQGLQMEGRDYNTALELATGQEVTQRLEQIETVFIGLYQQQAAAHWLLNQIDRRPAPEGFAEFGDVYTPGKMKLFEGTSELNDWESASFRVDAYLKYWAGGIDVHKLSRIDSITGGGFTKSLNRKVDIAIQDEEESAVSLLETNAVHPLTGDNFFSTTNPIPNTDATFSNTDVFAVTDITTMRLAIRGAQSGLLKQTNVSGGRVHDHPDEISLIVLANPDNLTLLKDAIEPGNIGGGTILNDKAPLRGVRDVYHSDVTPGQFYYFLANPAFPAFVMAEEESSNLISTMGQMSNYTKIMHNRELTQIRHSYGLQLGAAYSVFRTTAA